MIAGVLIFKAIILPIYVNCLLLLKLSHSNLDSLHSDLFSCLIILYGLSSPGSPWWRGGVVWLWHHLAVPQPAQSSLWIDILNLSFHIIYSIRYFVNEFWNYVVLFWERDPSSVALLEVSSFFPLSLLKSRF